MLASSRNAAGAAEHFVVAAKTIGIAVMLDGLDGRIARMTNTTSAFGGELDSLADVISFGVAPAVLAYAWGMHFADTGNPYFNEQLSRAGKLIAFLFLLSGSARLARFNVQKNPMPKNPGRPSKKYFVGLPIPAAAGMVAAIVFVDGAWPLVNWMFVVGWMTLLALLSFLMVCTWRYNSFKDLNLLQPRSPVVVIGLGALIFMIWNYAQPVLLALASTYVSSGIFVRIGGIVRRHMRPPGPKPEAERPVG